ncbi:MAG: DUF2267 domain-containing protein [Archangiaceae bacterium]|nr:DUF2267 domain-containing protein [Archangiaceae bacterium]
MPSSIEFLSRVAERAGLSAAEAGQLTRVTLHALSEQLHARAAAELAFELPPTLASWVASSPGPARGRPALLAQVAPTEPGSVAFTLEHVESVCEVLAMTLRPAALRALTEGLPDDVAVLLQRRDEGRASPVRVDSTHRTLAEADAPSLHPLFRAR